MNEIENLLGNASSTLATAHSARMTHDMYKEYTTKDPEQKEYYRQKNQCHSRIAKRKLKAVLIAIIIPLVLMILSWKLEIIPKGFAFLFMGWFSIGFITILFKSIFWMRVDAKAAFGNITSKEECDKLVKKL